METALPPVDPRSKLSPLPITVLLLTLIASAALPASAAGGKFIAHNTPAYVATAKNLGTEDATKTIEVSIWLKPHNRAALDRLALGLYDPSSPTFRHFLKPSQIATRFAPTAARGRTPTHARQARHPDSGR